MYVRVVLIDALSGDELRELGLFKRDFAIEFCETFCNQAWKNPAEFRLAVIADAETTSKAAA